MSLPFSSAIECLPPRTEGVPRFLPVGWPRFPLSHHHSKLFSPKSEIKFPLFLLADKEALEQQISSQEQTIKELKASIRRLETALKAKLQENRELEPYRTKLAEIDRQLASLQQQLEIERRIVPDEKEVSNFMTMLAAPSRGAQNAATAAGGQLFNQLGCGSCHVASLTSGSSATASLANQTYHPYSDFLLHDMGSLGDGIVMADSTGSEMRTAPLWGLRFFNRYLHDGRATTLDQAIAAHDGQARAARDRYAALAADARANLIAFLQSL